MGKRSRQRRKAKSEKVESSEAAKKEHPAAAAAKKEHPAAAAAVKKKGSPASNPTPSSSTLKPLKKIKKKDKHEASHGKMENKRIFGFVFMCNSKTKAECYQNRVFGMSRGKFEIVKMIQPGTMLFLYDIDLKLLYGIYKAESRGGMNLVDHAFDGDYPAQVKFLVDKDCLPIHVSEFKKAIWENFVSADKFEPELSRIQVTKLLSLFKPISTAPEPTPVYLPAQGPHVPQPMQLTPRDTHVPTPMQLAPPNMHVPPPLHLTPLDRHVPPPMHLTTLDRHVPPPMHLTPHPDPSRSRRLPTPVYMQPPSLPPVEEPYRTRLIPEDRYLARAANHGPLPPVEEPYRPTRLLAEDLYHAHSVNYGPKPLNDPYPTLDAPVSISVSRLSDASLHRPTRLPLEDPYHARGANHVSEPLNDSYLTSGYIRVPVPVSRPSDAHLSANDPYYRAGHIAMDVRHSAEYHTRDPELVPRYADSTYTSASYPYDHVESSQDYHAQNPIRSDSYSHRVPSERIFNSRASFSDIARAYQFTTTSLNPRP